MIERQLRDRPPAPLRFSGTGNYHYLTLFFLRQIHQPFTLVLFDHHTDMQPPAFGSLLSCGSWLKYAVDTLPALEQVFIVGAGRQMIDATAGPYGSRVCCLDDTDVEHRDWIQFLIDRITTPVYLSIDKDVFSDRDVRTNWDQGHLRLDTFLTIRTRLLSSIRLLGADVCGDLKEAVTENDRVNRLLTDCFQSQEFLRPAC